MGLAKSGRPRGTAFDVTDALGAQRRVPEFGSFVMAGEDLPKSAYVPSALKRPYNTTPNTPSTLDCFQNALEAFSHRPEREILISVLGRGTVAFVLCFE